MKIQKINQWFGHTAEQIIRWRWAVLVLFAGILAFSVVGLGKVHVETSWDDYFVEDDPMLLKTDEFKEIFGNDYFVAVLTECDNVFTKPNLELIRELSNELMDSISYADKITSLTDIEFMVGTDEGMHITQIVPEEIPADAAGLEAVRQRAYSKKNVARKLVSTDGRLSWILLKLRPFPEDSVWRKEADVAPDMFTGMEADRIITKAKYASLHPRGAGMPHMNVHKMRFIGSEMSRLMLIAIIVSILIMAWVTRSVRGVIAPLLTTISGIIIAYGLMGHLDLYVDSSTMIIPIILTFAVSIAYCIHIYSFYRRGMLLHGRRRDSIIHAISETGWPVLFSGLTTLSALLSFLAIKLMPMRFVGINASLCVLFVLLTALIITPILLSFGKDRAPNPDVVKRGDTRLSRLLAIVGHRSLRHEKPILITSAVIVVFCIVGMTRIEPAFDVERTNGRRVPYVRDILELSETELGSIYSYDIMIEFDEDGRAKLPENLRRLDELTAIAEAYPLTKRTTSVLDILKDLNRTINNNDEAFYTIPDSEEEVAQLLLLYENAGGSESEYWLDYDYRRLRLMIELGDFNSGEAERELADIQERALSIFPGATVTAVGNLPQFVTMMQYVVYGQINSFLISLLIIAVLMTIVFGSWRTGLIAMIPNIAPALVAGGYMGWMGIPLDMMTATLIPMILGLAVDDTIHFINHSRLEFEKTHNYSQSIVSTFRKVGVPLIMTTLIISATFLGYTTSTSRQFVNFGLLAIFGMLSALLADLFITPFMIKRFHIFGKDENK